MPKIDAFILKKIVLFLISIIEHKNAESGLESFLIFMSLYVPSLDSFITNDLLLNNNKKQIAIITGPNMAGKSTFLRQIGHIVILAQIGSYVPAEYCNISLGDQVVTRVGASDNISQGESTFLVEMNEASYILNNSTKNSFIILDEIGRGTSTFDGLALAWSITEFIHNNKKIRLGHYLQHIIMN